MVYLCAKPSPCFQVPHRGCTGGVHEHSYFGLVLLLQQPVHGPFTLHCGDTELKQLCSSYVSGLKQKTDAERKVQVLRENPGKI